MIEADGILERAGGRSVLRFRRRLAHPRERVWAALTEDEHLEVWFPTTIEGARQPGSALRFSFRRGEADPFAGEMTAFDPPSLMELRWAEDLLRFELVSDGPACVLTLTVTFPEHGKAARDAAGWHVCLDRLDVVAAGSEPPAAGSGDWDAVYAGYVERFGPEASAIGPPRAGSG